MRALTVAIAEEPPDLLRPTALLYSQRGATDHDWTKPAIPDFHGDATINLTIPQNHQRVCIETPPGRSIQRVLDTWVAAAAAENVVKVLHSHQPPCR